MKTMMMNAMKNLMTTVITYLKRGKNAKEIARTTPTTTTMDRPTTTEHKPFIIE